MSTNRAPRTLERPTASGLAADDLIARMERYGVADTLADVARMTCVSPREIVSSSRHRRATCARAALVHALRARAWSYRDIAALLDRDAGGLQKLAAQWPAHPTAKAG